MLTVVNMFRGFCMALADSVPGVSGGTIAFLLGFYDEFINSLNNLIRGNRKERVEALKFLIKLGIGWVIGFGLAVSILASFFEKGIYNASSLFLGFIIFAIPVMIKEEKECLKGKYLNLIFALIGASLVVAISSLKFGVNVDPNHLTLGTTIYVFVAGMLAISAMVLPGISGSTILFSFGLYLSVITGIKELMHFEFDSVWLILTLGLGIIAGVFVSLKGIKKVLKSYRSATIYTVIGMMVGSLYAIVIGPTTLDIPKEILTLETFNIGFFILGGVVLLLIQLFKSYTEKKHLD